MTPEEEEEEEEDPQPSTMTTMGDVSPQPPASPQPSVEDDTNFVGMAETSSPMEPLSMGPTPHISDVTDSSSNEMAPDAAPGTAETTGSTPLPAGAPTPVGGGIGGGGGAKEAKPSVFERGEPDGSSLPLIPHPHTFHGPQTRGTGKASYSQPQLTLNQLAIVSAAQHKLPTSRMKEIVARVGRHTMSSAKKQGRWYKGDNYVDNANYSWRNLELFEDYQMQMYTPSGAVKATCKK